MRQPRLPWTPRPPAELRRELRAVGTPVALEILRLGCDLDGGRIAGQPCPDLRPAVESPGRRYRQDHLQAAEDGMRRRLDAAKEARCLKLWWCVACKTVAGTLRKDAAAPTCPKCGGAMEAGC